MIGEAVGRFGFCGIKVHRHDARITREICEVARAHALPVLYDVMGEVSTVELLATEYPDVAFIIPHLGSFADDWKAQRAFLDPLARHANVFTDTSGVRRFDLLEEAVRRAGPQKVLFGSDGPWLHPGVELAKIGALRLSPAAERLVLGGNLLRLIGRVRARRTRSTPIAVPAGPAPDTRPDPWLDDAVPAIWSTRSTRDCVAGRARLPQCGPPQLQCPVCHPQSRRGALEVPLFLADREPHRRFRDRPDLPSGNRQHRTLMANVIHQSVCSGGLSAVRPRECRPP